MQLIFPNNRVPKKYLGIRRFLGARGIYSNSQLSPAKLLEGFGYPAVFVALTDKEIASA